MISIAISAVVKPSRILLIYTLGMGLGTASFGVLLGIGWIGTFSFPNRLVIALFCIGSALAAILCQLRTRKTLRIDISGIGQIRLREDTTVVHVSDERQDIPDLSHRKYQMIDGSTLWSGLLILHLQSSDGRVEKLRILPDSVTSDEFRALYIACRWIAARKTKEVGLINIS